MVEIGAKIIFVGFPVQVLDGEPAEFIAHFLEELKKKDFVISLPNNQDWAQCKQNINNNYQGLCGFISYDEFIHETVPCKNVHLYEECDAIIFFSKIHDKIDMQEDEFSSIIFKHFLKYTNDRRQHTFDDFLDNLKNDIQSYFQDNRVIKNLVNVKIDEILSNNPKCKFCLIPLSGAVEEYADEGEYTEFIQSKSKVSTLEKRLSEAKTKFQTDEIQTVVTIPQEFWPPLTRLIHRLNTFKLITSCLDYESNFTSRDFDYFYLLLKSKQCISRYDDLSFLNFESSIFNSERLTSPNSKKTKIIILPYITPDEFEENIIKLILKMGYETRINFDLSKLKVAKICPNKSSQIFPLNCNSLKFTKLYKQIGLIKYKFDKYKHNDSESKNHILIGGQYSAGQQEIANGIALYSKDLIDMFSKGKISSTPCTIFSNENIRYTLFGDKDNPGLITQRLAVIILRDIDLLEPKSLKILFDFMDHGKFLLEGENIERTSVCNIIATTTDPNFMINHKRRFIILKVPNLNDCRADIGAMAKSFCKAYCCDWQSNEIWKHLQENHLHRWETMKWNSRDIEDLQKEVQDYAIEFGSEAFPGQGRPPNDGSKNLKPTL